MLSAVILITALAWFTVSSPFVYAGQQEQARQHKKEKSAYPLTAGEEEATNPPGNNAEEKTPGSNTLSEEFIHEHHLTSDFPVKISLYHNSKNADTYIAFHGELLVPPPNRL